MTIRASLQWENMTHSGGKASGNKTSSVRVIRSVLAKYIHPSLMIRALAFYEKKLFAKGNTENIVGPVFILGPPRSGTTLLYETLASHCDFAYMTNLHNRYSYAPLSITKLIGWRLRRNRTAQYESSYGRISGLTAPSEAGEFWYRWFPRGIRIHTGYGQLHSGQISEMRRVIDGMQNMTGRHLLFKNTYNSMRIGALLETFPNAVFLVSRRNPVDTAQSLLLARRNRLSNKSKWFSVPPREYEEIVRGTPEQQVVDQVFCIE